MQTTMREAKIAWIISSMITLFLVPSLLVGTETIQGVVDSIPIVKSSVKFMEKRKESHRSRLPIGLSIPNIHINIPIERVGLTTEGAMDTPKNPDSAAWFDLGPRPGEIGNAVIDGHYGVYKNGKVSVFNNLHTLKMGNHILVKDDAGNHITFIVRKLRIYSRHEHPPEVFLSNDGLSHLNIITCQGIWDRKAKNYPNRLVVFADKVM